MISSTYTPFPKICCTPSHFSCAETRMISPPSHFPKSCSLMHALEASSKQRPGEISGRTVKSHLPAHRLTTPLPQKPLLKTKAVSTGSLLHPFL